MANQNFSIKKKLSQEKVQSLMEIFNKHNIKFEDDFIYILPEDNGEGIILNEFAPDFMKIARKNNIKCELIYNKENNSYLSLRDSEILLPIIMNIFSGVGGNLILEYIKYYISKINKKTAKLRVRTINKEKDSSYSKIEISGDADYVLKALEEILKHNEDDNNEI